eukprot:s2598_g7.t1
MSTVARYNEDERAAFENGYRAAIQDVLVMVGAGLFGMAFLTVCLSPSLYHKVREKVRPWVVVQVELGRPWVIWVQKFRSGWLDRLHLFAANTCGVTQLRTQPGFATGNVPVDLSTFPPGWRGIPAAFGAHAANHGRDRGSNLDV